MNSILILFGRFDGTPGKSISWAIVRRRDWKIMELINFDEPAEKYREEWSIVTSWFGARIGDNDEILAKYLVTPDMVLPNGVLDPKTPSYQLHNGKEIVKIYIETMALFEEYTDQVLFGMGHPILEMAKLYELSEP